MTEPPFAADSQDIFKHLSFLISDKAVPTVFSSTQSSTLAPGSTNQGRSSTTVTGGLLAQKTRHVSQKGDVVPTALPHNLLPLLGRGLSISSLSGGRSLGRQSGGLLQRVKPPTSAAASEQGSAPTEPLPKDTHSPRLHAFIDSPKLEITTVGSVQDVDAVTDTETVQSGTAAMFIVN